MAKFFETLIYLLYSWMHGGRAFVEPTLMDLTFAQHEMAQELAVSRVSLVSHQGQHSFGFKVTNLQPTTRCFMNFTLQPLGRSANLDPIESYVNGPSVHIGDDEGTTTTCLRSGETGFVLGRVTASQPPHGFVLQAVTELKRRDRTVTPQKKVTIVRQIVEGRAMRVALKNETMEKGFQSIGYTKWVITQGEKILGWGFLDSGARWTRNPVKLHETVEITTDHVLGQPLPKGAELQIILDDME